MGGIGVELCNLFESVTFCRPEVGAIEHELTDATSHGFNGAVIFPPYYATINFLHINFIRFTTANKTEDE
jgi:hypothetical protein